MKRLAVIVIGAALALGSCAAPPTEKYEEKLTECRKALDLADYAFSLAGDFNDAMSSGNYPLADQIIEDLATAQPDYAEAKVACFEEVS